MADGIEIRTITEEELAPFVEAMATAFLERPDVAQVAEELKPLWDRSRLHAAFEDGRIVGTFRSFATELTVPGCARLPASAISSVTVMPTHRRRGILRRMIAAEHSAMRERGDVFGLLYASEFPIYGRFGYGAGCRSATWTLDTRAAVFHPSTADPAGSVELVKPTVEIRDAIKAVFEAWRLRQPGEIRRRESPWDYGLGLKTSAWDGLWKGFLALHRDETGAVDGYARYKAEGKWEERQPRGRVEVQDLHALTDDAYVALWRYLAGIDWIASVSAEWRSVGERLPWLLVNARAAAVSEVGDGMWVRPGELPRALASRTYERAGRLTLEVVDPEAENGRWRVDLDATADGATCRPTERSPDLTLSLGAVGAAYLGGVPLRHAVLAAGADEHRPGALAEADALFRTLDEPWCSSFF